MTRWYFSNDGCSSVARQSHNLTDRHWKKVVKITAWLHGTRGLGLAFVRRSVVDWTACSDADYADTSTERRSVSGTVFVLGLGPSVGHHPEVC